MQQETAVKAEGQARRVIIVDDGEDTAESLAAILEFWGYQVRTAKEGEAALKLMATGVPDAVVLDIGLPGMNGYELATRLRSTHGNGLLLIAMTGYGREEDVARARVAGFDVHLTKPVDPDELRSIIEGGKRAGAALPA